MLPRLLRLGAIAIALLAIVDPRVTTTRTVKPVVAVVDTTSPRSSAGSRASSSGVTPDDGLADRVSGMLDGAFTVVRHALPGAAAAVAVGDRPPAGVEADGSPALAVVREPAGATIEIEHVAVPDRAPVEARVTVGATVRALSATGHHIDVTLSAGDLVVDRVAHEVASADDRFDVALTLVPAAEGSVALQIAARDATDASAGAAADASIDIQHRPWAVLVFDAHPTWASTFVRRALEHDTRFAVTTRVDTSRDASTSIGQPPVSLSSFEALRIYDAIIVGAPDDLTPADIAGLEAFARRRAGAVVLILDTAPARKYDRLLRVDRWSESTNSAALAVDATAPVPAHLQASEIVWPDALPPGAEPLATVTVSGSSRPAIWQMPVGAGRIVVSGALDAWRSRAAASAAFDEYWRTVVAGAAQASPAPMEVTIQPGLTTSNAGSIAVVTMRDLALDDARVGDGGRAVHATASARLDGPDGSTPLRLWPDSEPGRWRAFVRAPAKPGAYRVIVTSGDLTASATMGVAPAVATAQPDGRDLLRAWAASRGGSSVPASRASDVRGLLARAIAPASAPQTWRPLRSPWWIMPFALLLGGEWWWRRRRGLL